MAEDTGTKDLDGFSIEERCHARIGFIGNPSDGFGGKTMSLLLKNFEAIVTLRPSASIVFLPNPKFDPTSWASLEAFRAQTQVEGYYGGLRLISATVKKFADCCAGAGLDAARTQQCFTLSYDSTIPRMVGLSGSSAIVTATFFGLCKFYCLDIEGDLKIPKTRLPQVILDIENVELGIAAGLQDRVIQVYGGLVHMDFADVASKGHGAYTPLDPALLPALYLVWNAAAAGDSGKVHSTVRQVSLDRSCS